jgi:hypothetical protein
MRVFLHILTYKLITFVKTTFDLRFVSVVRGIGSLIVFGGFAVGAYFLSSWITTFVLDQTRIGLYLFHRFISMMLFVFFVAVNLGNIVVSYATLYRSSEVDLVYDDFCAEVFRQFSVQLDNVVSCCLHGLVGIRVVFWIPVVLASRCAALRLNPVYVFVRVHRRAHLDGDHEDCQSVGIPESVDGVGWTVRCYRPFVLSIFEPRPVGGASESLLSACRSVYDES